MNALFTKSREGRFGEPTVTVTVEAYETDFGTRYEMRHSCEGETGGIKTLDEAISRATAWLNADTQIESLRREWAEIEAATGIDREILLAKKDLENAERTAGFTRWKEARRAAQARLDELQALKASADTGKQVSGFLSNIGAA